MALCCPTLHYTYVLYMALHYIAPHVWPHTAGGYVVYPTLFYGKVIPILCNLYYMYALHSNTVLLHCVLSATCIIPPRLCSLYYMYASHTPTVTVHCIHIATL